jgi:DNA-binding PadR family transcriptional regulator
MQLDELLVARKLVTPEGIERAAARRRERGGRLADSLLALRLISLQQLDAVLRMAPPSAPGSIEETGIDERNLLRLLIATMYALGDNTAPKLSEAMKLTSSVVTELLQRATDRKLVEIVGTEGGGALRVVVYALTDLGRAWAIETQEQTKYVGPAPVPVEAYRDQITRQRIVGDKVGRERIRKEFSDLVFTDRFVTRLGPAINSGRAMLLFGPPGNGKTSVSEKIGRVFADIIYIPYCIDVEGQIIRIFDPSIHDPVPRTAPVHDLGIRREEFDTRWVACHRPTLITGGELTLEMLDLSYSQLSGFYEAPLHVKALGGTFVIDDFGRQLVRPNELLNRWAIPLEDGVDYFKLHTGKTFSLPFDELVIFSTNLVPDDLMDPAFLRRIPYKLEVGAPSVDEYEQIFRRLAEGQGLSLPESFTGLVIERLREMGMPLAYYQPRFILDQIVAACRFDDKEPRIDEEYLQDVLDNLHARPRETRSAHGQPPILSEVRTKPAALAGARS